MSDADEYANLPLSYAKLRVIEMAYYRYLQEKKMYKPSPHIFTWVFIIIIFCPLFLHIVIGQMEPCILDDTEHGGTFELWTDEMTCDLERSGVVLGVVLTSIFLIIILFWYGLFAEKNYKKSMSPKLALLAKMSQMPSSKYDQLESLTEERVLKHVESILNHD